MAVYQLWDTLPPQNVTSEPSVAIFRKPLKTSLQSVVLPNLCNARAQDCSHFGHYNRDLFTYLTHLLTFRAQQTSSPQHLSQHILLRTSARNIRSSSVPLQCVPSFARRSFSTAAPLTWNSLPPAVLNCDSLSLSLYFQMQT